MARIAKESWILIAICAADLVTTIWLVCAGMAIEGNPVRDQLLEFPSRLVVRGSTAPPKTPLP